MGDALVDRLRVKPGRKLRLAEVDPRDRLGLDGKDAAIAEQERLRAKLFELQGRLWAESSRGLLVVLQALDAGGKDGTIRAVFTGVNPQGCDVHSFKAPSEEERAHDYLWRVHQVVPRRGEIGIFNRSHYEDVLVVRVENLVPEARWRKRYAHIRDFERLIADEGTTIVKFFLHISPEEQKDRLTERLADPAKRWKFRKDDLVTRSKWDQYMAAYEDAINETATDDAPWYVIPADRNWVRNTAVMRVLVHTLDKMDPRIPPPDPGLDGITVT